MLIMVMSARNKSFFGLSRAEALAALRDFGKEAREGNTAPLFKLVRSSSEAAFGLAIYLPDLGDLVGTHGMRLSDAIRESGQQNISMFIDWVKVNSVNVNVPAIWQSVIYDEESARKILMQARPLRLLARDPEGLARTLDIARNSWLEGRLSNPNVAGHANTKAAQLKIAIPQDFPSWPFL